MRSTSGFNKVSNILWILSASFLLQSSDAFLSSPVSQATRTTRFAILDRDVKEKKKDDRVNGVKVVNGEAERPKSILMEEEEINGTSRTKKKKVEKQSKEKPKDAEVMSTDILNIMEEVNNRVVSGTADILSNLTLGVEQQLGKLPEASPQELSSLLTELTTEIERAQRTELERQIADLEKRMIRPLEDLAFSDVPLWEDKKKKKGPGGNETEKPSGLMRDQLVLMGKNSTLQVSRRMRTREILQNFNVAPFYYSIALLTRWARKASYPSIYLLSMYRNMANVVKSNTKAKKKTDFEINGGEGLQAGWKRTGEIAAKGSLSKKWAIFRRSAEIWAYFSSFYLKDRRISAKYNSGKWSEEKFKEERSKLGKEITDNLLKLGPTFIKGEYSFI